jgi:predicted membrane protein
MVFGVIVIMLGTFLLFRNLGYISGDVSRWVFSWQSLLIALGAIFLFDRKTDNKNAGLILVLVGGVFLLSKIMDIDLGRILIPALLIVVGIILFVRASTKGRSKVSANGSDGWKFYDDKKQPFEKTTLDGAGCVRQEYLFNGFQEKWRYGKLKNVEIDAVFSGVELDFSQAELAEDVKAAAHIKVSSVFSGVNLYVPDDWNIVLQKTGVFGGFTDKRPQNIPVNKEKTVILELDAVFGGGEIRCYD